MNLTLQERIRRFYDASSGLWEQVWGEHMHHGYYASQADLRIDRRQAQINLIEELLRWGQVEQATHILDIGCGIGGSSLHLAQAFGAKVNGITLSPVQANRAIARAETSGLSDQTCFEVADALQMPFPDNTFDLVWSLESGEHMPDKARFVQECYRVLKPGGTFLMATWCHRPTDPPDEPLTAPERQQLNKIYQVYCLPFVIALPQYEAIAQSVGFQAIHTDDWSKEVAPFWDVVVRSAFTPRALIGLLRSGWTTIVAALSVRLMQQGYRSGLIRFGVLRATKPESAVR